MQPAEKHIFLAWIAHTSCTRATTAALCSWLNGRTKLHRKAIHVVVLDRNLVKLTKEME